MAKSTRVTRQATRTASAKTRASIQEEPVQLSSPPETPVTEPTAPNSRTAADWSSQTNPLPSQSAAERGINGTPNVGRKRARSTGDGALTRPPRHVKSADMIEEPAAKKSKPSRNPTARKGFTSNATHVKQEDEDGKEMIEDLAQKATPRSVKGAKRKAMSGMPETPMRTTTSIKQKKKKTYGLTIQDTPYPDWPHPTPEECKEVVDLLSSIHGKVVQPKTIPEPSLNVSGCGEVPSVLDALIRTRLSAATTNKNSSAAFAGLVKKFGILKQGIGKGSVDWNKVRLAPSQEIFEAIECGGLGDVKSKSIKKILQTVWEENQERRAQLVAKGRSPGSIAESQEEKETEVARAQQNVVSLDHLHTLSTADAFDALIKYDGIGVKTASCVLLFCLQRPSFAVDTHVFRLCSWLGWVPPPGNPAGLKHGAKGPFRGATRDSTFAHCEVRIPDEYKYPLHYLLIKHGKTCPRCRAITGENSEGWHKGCAIDHLVRRTGARKGGKEATINGPASPKSTAKASGSTRSSKKRIEYLSDSAVSSDASSREDSNMSKLGSVDEESASSSEDISD